MVHLNCHWASHQSQEHLPTWLAPIWHSLSTFPFYTLLYSSSRPPFYSPFSSPVTRTPLSHKTTTKRLAPLSNSLSAFPFYIPLYSSSIPPPIWLALFWHSNSILFLYLLSTVYTPFLHPLSTYWTLHCGRRGSSRRSQLWGLLTSVQLAATKWSAQIWILPHFDVRTISVAWRLKEFFNKKYFSYYTMLRRSPTVHCRILLW